MDHLVRRAAETMLSLGIARREVIQPHLEAWLNRPPNNATHDDESELAAFLTTLLQARVINRSQGMTLMTMLTERAPTAADDPFIGRRFGSFIAEELVGEGAMGKVYRACREGTLERDFVIKVFGSTTDEAAIARFRREGDVMARLDHPNIVKVVGSGQEGSQAYLVLEYCQGPTLHEMLTERKRFSWNSATRAMKQIAAAIAAAHDQGIIHRDMKPQNVLVAPGGMLKVFDFGLAKTLDSKASSLSQAGEIIGSPAFMAPEQWGDHQVDERADLFALGVIFYLLIAGETPFKGRTPADYSWKIREGTYEPLHRVVPEVPLEVSQVVAQLLEKDRAWRTPGAHRLIEDLDRLLRARSPNVPRVEVIDARTNSISQRFGLVGKASFTAGSDMDADVFVDGPEVAEEHAVFERSEAELLLKARGGETRVNGKPVKEIALRDKDLIVLGQGPTLRYRVGNLGRRNSSRAFGPASERLKPLLEQQPEAGQSLEPPVVVPGLLCDALRASAHPRTLMLCFEALDPYTLDAALEQSRLRLVRAGLPKDQLEAAMERALRLAEEEVWRLADHLFTRTKENLGRSVEAWLAWWFEVRGRFPRQFVPPSPRARGHLTITASPDEKAYTADLSTGEDWVVGRADECDICIKERSVSRQHMTLHRLARRFAYVDLGSRFGTTIDGKRISVGFLREGDRLQLGRATLTFNDPQLGRVEEAAGGLVGIEPLAFRALVQLRSTSVVRTLIKLLDPAPLLAYCSQALGAHDPSPRSQEALRAFLAAQSEMARATLPGIAQVDLGPDPAGWQSWWAQHHAALGPQVEPFDWSS